MMDRKFEAQMDAVEVRVASNQFLNVLTEDDAPLRTHGDNLIAAGMRFAQTIIHQDNVKAGWWMDLETGESLKGKRNVPEMLALVHSEVSEALEAHRKNLNDDKLPHRKGIEVEIADAIIRLLDIGAGLDLDIGGAIAEKLAYNRQRADHKPENRKLAGGKAF